MSEKFQIHLQGTADAQQWVQAETQLKKLDSAASDFLNSLKAGVGIDLGGRLVNGVAQLQGLFTGIVDRGYEFNKTMAQSEGGIANVLAKFMKLDQQAAKQEAAKAMAAIMEWEPKAAGSLQDLTLGFMSTVGAGQAAGITVAQNVELVGKFANALAALGMDASQLTQELRAIFTGNITSDAQLAKTLQITPEAVRSAKEAGTFYDYLNKQLGSLGDTANGPSVALSSLQSAIDKAAGALTKPLFEEVIQGAEQLTKVLDDPAIKAGLEEAGVSIASLVKAGVQLSVWAVQNAPMLLGVAEAALKIGSAIAAIKLTELLAGLVLKAARWGQATIMIEANTAALGRNAIAQRAAQGSGVAGVAGATTAITPGTAANAGTTAGKAGGSAMGSAWANAFKGVAGVALNAGLMAVTVFAVHAVTQYIEAWALSEEAKLNADAASKARGLSEVDKVQKATTTAVSPADQAEASKLANETKARFEREGREQLRLLKEARAYRDSINAFTSPNEKVFASEAADRAEQEFLDTTAKIAKIEDLVAAMRTSEGATENLRRKTIAADEAEKSFAAALIKGQAAAGDNAAKIQLASNAVDSYAKKLSEAAAVEIDTSSFESVLKSLQGLDTLKLDDNAMKDVTALIEAAGTLRDLKADAAKEAEGQADKQKKAADDLREAEIRKLELQSRAAAAADKGALSRDLQARADALKLRAELEAQGMTPETAAGVVKSEQGKDQAKRSKDEAAEQARKELAMQVAALEDEIAAKRGAGDKQGEQAAQDRLSALQLARQLEDQLGLTREQADARAQTRVQNDRAASERDAFKGGLGGGGGFRSSGPARLSSADTWGDGRNAGGLRGDGGSSLTAMQSRMRPSLRESFQFPSLDAFAARQPAKNGDPGMTPQKDGGADSSGAVANAAKQAAEAAAKAREASAKVDADLLANFQKLSSELAAMATQNQETSSQLAHSRA